MQGYIKLHRKIKDHWIYQEKRKFSKYEAWIDMLMTANHKDNKVVLGNELVDIGRGQFITSIRKLGERWEWSNTKVTKFLELLKQDGMIDFKKDTKKTVVTIENYGFYHDAENTKTTQKEHEPNANRTQKHTDKNVKECIKNENKERHGENVLLKSSEYETLVRDYGEEVIEEKILDLDEYISNKGDKYKNHNLTLRKWIRKDGIKKQSEIEEEQRMKERREHIETLKGIRKLGLDYWQNIDGDVSKYEEAVKELEEIGQL